MTGNKLAQYGNHVAGWVRCMLTEKAQAQGQGSRYPCPSHLCLSPSRFWMPPSSAVVPAVPPKQLHSVLLSGCQFSHLALSPSRHILMCGQWLGSGSSVAACERRCLSPEPSLMPTPTPNYVPLRTEMHQLPPASQSVWGPDASALPALELELGAWVGLPGTLFHCGETRLGE